jgi:tetratricopeptide (TPR) repeat protein
LNVIRDVSRSGNKAVRRKLERIGVIERHHAAHNAGQILAWRKRERHKRRRSCCRMLPAPALRVPANCVVAARVAASCCSFSKTLFVVSRSRVGHSFGTHIIAWALYGIPENKRPPVHTIVLASSVLKNSFPWQRLHNHPVKRVINDCAMKDVVLFFSQFCVLFTGMAGRLGFNGGTGNNFANRFFDWGHSGYFGVKGNDDYTFMQTYWVPLLTTDAPPIMREYPKGSALSGIAWTLLNSAAPIKLFLYVTPVVLFASWIYSQEQMAERSFATVDGLLTDFVEVLSQNVAPSAPVATVESVVRHVQQAIEKPPAEPNALLTAQRARMYIMLAELKFEQGDIKTAHENASKAHDLMAALKPAADNNPEALHLLARSNILIARSFEEDLPSNFARAEDSYKLALEQLQQLEQRFHKSPRIQDGWQWLRSLALLHRHLGDFLLSRFNKVDEADKAFQASLAIFKKLRQLRADDAETDFDLAWAYNKVGDVLYQKGNAVAAYDQFEMARRHIADLGEPYLWANLEWRRSLAVVQGNIGLCLREQMKFEEAIKAFVTSREEIKALRQRDPKRGSSTLAWTHDVIGETKINWPGRSRRCSRWSRTKRASWRPAKSWRPPGTYAPSWPMAAMLAH